MRPPPAGLPRVSFWHSQSNQQSGHAKACAHPHGVSKIKEREKFMSVPLWKRSSSKLDTFYEAVKLRYIVTQMIMRSFGLNTKKKRPKKLIPDKMRQEHPDLVKLFKKIDEYQEMVEETELLRDYEEWMLEKVRDNLFRYCSDLVAHISGANEILCKRQCEYEERLILMDIAICDLAAIKQEVNFVEEFFDIDLNKYMNYSEQQEKVKNFLYKWKKSFNKEFDKFLEQEAEWKDVE